MFFVTDKHVFTMAALRIISGMIEFSAALLMLKLNRVDQALKVNAALALVGPMIMLTVMSIGLVGLAGKVPVSKMLLIIFGVGLIFYGVRKV